MKSIEMLGEEASDPKRTEAKRSKRSASIHLFHLDRAAEWWVFSGDTPTRRPVLIGLHGGPGVDGTGLRYALAPLAEVAQVIVPDQRGHGRSEGGTPASWNLPHWAADVEGFCEAACSGQSSLASRSAGSWRSSTPSPIPTSPPD